GPGFNYEPMEITHSRSLLLLLRAGTPIWLEPVQSPARCHNICTMESFLKFRICDIYAYSMPICVILSTECAHFVSHHIRLGKNNSQLHMEKQKPRIAKSSLYNKAISGGITIPDFKLYYRATVLKTAWYWHKNRHVDQWNRIEDPDISPHRYENLIFDKDAKTVKWKRDSIFNKWCWHNWMSTCRRLQIDPYLSPCTKLKFKWIEDLNINPVTLNLIEEKVGSTLEHIGIGDQFLNITPTAQTLSATINQWDYMKLRSFCKAKDTVTKTKRQPTEWEKIFTNPTSDRGLISRIYKELKKHDIKTSNSPIEKWAIELNREFTAEEYRMAKDI
ncbi:hypothetical protein STEG23_018522, partial [Scotinomys teguina]